MSRVPINTASVPFPEVMSNSVAREALAAAASSDNSGKLQDVPLTPSKQASKQDVVITVTPSSTTRSQSMSARKQSQYVDRTSQPLLDEYKPKYEEETGPSWTEKISESISTIMQEKDSKHLFIFISINFIFMFMEFFYGIFANSLGLISDAFHMLFDCAALAMSLAAMLMSKQKAHPTTYSYGFERFEVLAGFTNAIFLVFVSGYIVVEAIQRIYSPEEIGGDQLITVSVLGLMVNLVGIFFFHDHAHSHGGHGHSHGGHGHSHGGAAAHDENLHGVFLHILADTLGSVGVIISSYLVKWKQWYTADPIMALIISAFILMSAMPLYHSTRDVLLQKRPTRNWLKIERALREAATLEGVLECRQERFWEMSPDTIVGSFCVRVRHDANEQVVLELVHNLFADLVEKLSIQVEKDDWLVPGRA